MRNNSYKLNWFYEYNIQEVNSTKILSKYTFMLGHFKKSASILTDQETQMVGNDQWLATTCNTEQCCTDIPSKHFLKSQQLHKIFNHNTVKVKYSCLNNMSKIIMGHNRKLTIKSCD